MAESINKTCPIISHIERPCSATFNTLEKIIRGLGIELSDLQNVSSKQILSPSALDSPECRSLICENELLVELVKNQPVRMLYLKEDLKRRKEGF
ncbi:MAG: hypothetical protein FJY15_06215 [Bacteroidetes bacterium]|nr:hypothetical protein [Bacteroidota bacterium]